MYGSECFAPGLVSLGFRDSGLKLTGLASVVSKGLLF